MNPFAYGGVVGNGDFCNRTRELADLTETMNSAGNCFVYAERRMGKTSLVQRAMDKLSQRSFLPVYVDLWPTDGSVAFATATARALTMAAETKTTKLLELGKSLFGRLRPSVMLDDSDQPKVDFGLEGRSLAKPDLMEVLAAPETLAARTGKTIVMVFDEFQQIAQYESDLTERQPRSSIQHHKNVAYLFLGSRKHLLQSMFLDQSRPLYRSAMHYPIGPIETKHWQPFIVKKFKATNKSITKPLVADLCERTQGHPFYTQHLCNVLWSLVDPGQKVADQQLELAVTEMLLRESHAYVTLWESLTKNEQRFLRGLADSKSPPKPFSSESTRKYGLRSASNAQRAADSLVADDVIEREESSFVIIDRFLRMWIRRL